MPKTIDDFPEVKQLLDDCAIAVESRIGFPVTVYYRMKIHIKGAEDVVNAVCSVCNVTWPQILSGKRYHNIVIARQMFCWFMTRFLGRTTVETGAMINQHHSTAINGRDTIDDMIATNNNEYIVIAEKIKAILFV